MRQRLTQARRHVAMPPRQLESLSPLAILARGYSLTERVPTADVVDTAR